MLQMFFYLTGLAMIGLSVVLVLMGRADFSAPNSVTIGLLCVAVAVLMGRVDRMERLLKPHLDKMEAREDEKLLRRPRPNHPTEV